MACAIYMQVFFFLSAVTTSAMSLLIMRSVHNMDCPRTRWTESPRIVMQCATHGHQMAVITSDCDAMRYPRASNGRYHLGL